MDAAQAGLRRAPPLAPAQAARLRASLEHKLGKSVSSSEVRIWGFKVLGLKQNPNGGWRLRRQLSNVHQRSREGALDGVGFRWGWGGAGSGMLPYG